MPNTILTSSEITREALRVLHAELIFINKCDTQYDSRFSGKGGRIGDTLLIKKPAKLVTRVGKTRAPQSFEQSSIALTLSQQLGLDVDFTDRDLALSLDDFSAEFIKPAMAQLATDISVDVASMILKSANSVYNSQLVFKDFLTARKNLTNALAPVGEWCAIIDPSTAINVVDEISGRFQDSSEISKQYRTGAIGIGGGFKFYESTVLPSVINPADIIGTATVTDTSSVVALAGLTDGQVLPVGFRFNIAGIFKVHAETKRNQGLYDFVVLEEVIVAGGGLASVATYPVFATGAKQNISAIPAGGSAIITIGGAGVELRAGVAFAPKAFTFATADLVIPKGMDMASTEVLDGISLRFVRGFDLNEGDMICRFDIIYGYQNLREEHSVALLEDNV